MFNRKLILLINDFFTYYTDLNLVETEFINPFSNIRVIFFSNKRYVSVSIF